MNVRRISDGARRIQVALQRFGIDATCAELQRLADHHDVELVVDIVETYGARGGQFSASDIEREINRIGLARLHRERRRS